MQEREMECKEWREGGDLDYSEERCHLNNLGNIQENSGECFYRLREIFK